MWKKIKNYRLNLKDLKFMLWLFGITCFIYSYNFIVGLAFDHKFQVYDLGGAIATFAAFMDTKNRIKNKNYKTA
ncbi:hypothetical protein COM21_28890 [Bacillus toyonensis]|uniref:hypothetical protein n=1 Tax=Bacillus TaxID=1386 RepID=UPI000BF27A9E|nr:MULTISPECIES: hypothetical protein [Bacillus]MBJ7961088.1 hypothetical protein [Bacillus cereus group sp. N28]MDM5436621.1 hypothetical protein [Bacillus hominis]PGC62077.1 hypothetical protein COM21_28890 [Bacillus toyonensis]RAN66796.1 hypothetical protein B5P40_28800 [Bacillus sp. SRB_8]